MNKLFIIGLPRTGTTSVSVALLEYGFKVAHTAYTKRAFELADVISDAPCFCDYQQLDALFPDSKFVYLDRALDNWVPSMQMLLKKMLANLDQKNGHFNPVLKRSFNTTFSLLTTSDPLHEQHLATCYRKHQQQVFDYFATREDFLKIDVSCNESLKKLLIFLNVTTEGIVEFPRLNVGKQVDNWKSFKHLNKVNSFSSGKEHRKFFAY
ncbi:MAG: sulfotransferase family protein [Pseudomonadota bacterium]